MSNMNMSASKERMDVPVLLRYATEVDNCTFKETSGNIFLLDSLKMIPKHVHNVFKLGLLLNGAKE